MEAMEKTYVRKAVPIFWTVNYSERKIINYDDLNTCLSKGWEVERVDELHDDVNVLMYILKREKNNEN